MFSKFRRASEKTEILQLACNISLMYIPFILEHVTIPTLLFFTFKLPEVKQMRHHDCNNCKSHYDIDIHSSNVHLVENVGAPFDIENARILLVHAHRPEHGPV